MAFGGSKVLEYIIRAKDATAQKVNEATARIQGFASKARAAISSFGKTLATNAANIQAALHMLKGVFGAFAGFVKSAIREAFSFEKTITDFKVLLGSIDEAKRHVAELRQFASKTPLTFGDLSSASKLLLSFGASVDEIVPSLRMLGDISLGNAQKFQGLALVFAQVKSAGKLMGQDLLQMINQGFNPLAIMAEQTGIAMGDLKDMMSEGAISFEMVEAAMRSATSEGGRFYNAMEESSTTGEGLVSTLKDNLTQALTTFGSALLGVTKDGLGGLIAKIQELNNDGTIAAWAEEVRQKVEAVVGGLKEAVDAVREFNGTLGLIWDATGSAAITMVKGVGKYAGGTIGSIAGGIRERSFGAFAAGMAETNRDVYDMAMRNSAFKWADHAATKVGNAIFGTKYQSRLEWERENADKGDAEQRAKVEQAKAGGAARAAKEKADAEAAEAAREAAKEPPKSLSELFAAAQAKREADKAAKEAEAAAKKAADEELKRQERLAKERERLEQQLERERERLAEKAYRKEVQLAQDAVSESIKAQGDAESRLAAAKQQVATAWTWYRDPTKMQAWIDDKVEQREAEARFDKDFQRLQDKWRTHGGWRDVEIGKMSAEEEAVRQVALAKEEEQAAQKALDAIEQNTRDLAEKLDELLTMKEA